MIQHSTVVNPTSNHQSSQSLLCRRCFVYDCALHNDPPVDAPPKVEKEEIPLPTSPCGADCYLNLPSTFSGLFIFSKRARVCVVCLFFRLSKKNKHNAELQRTDPGRKVTGEFSTRGHNF